VECNPHLVPTSARRVGSTEVTLRDCPASLSIAILGPSHDPCTQCRTWNIGLAVATSSTSWLTELERLVSLSARVHATPQTGSDLAPRTSRIGQIDVGAHLAAHGSVEFGGAALAIETCADFAIRPSDE
jgi:hypothetical protein